MASLFRRLDHARGRLGEMVAPAGLVIDDRDGAGVDAAERVLVSRVREAARREDADVLGRAVRLLDLVERPAVRAVEGPNRAVGRYTRATVVCVDVARPSRWPPAGAAGPGVTPSQTVGATPCQSPSRVARGDCAAPAADADDRDERDLIPTRSCSHDECPPLLSCGTGRTSTCVRRMPSTHRTIRRTPPTRDPTRVRSDRRSGRRRGACRARPGPRRCRRCRRP